MADYPTSDAKSLGLESNIKEGQYTSESGVMQARRYGAQRFSVTMQHPPLTKAEMMPVDAFIKSLRGRANSCELILPDKADPLGAIDGSSTPVLNSARARGSSSIAIDGLVASVTGIFNAGDMINFGNHTKAYKIVSTVDSEAHDAIAKADGTGVLLKADGSGDSLLMTRANQAILTIFPPLVEDVADGQSVVYGSGFRLTVKMKGDQQNYMVEPPNIYSKQVNFLEYVA